MTDELWRVITYDLHQYAYYLPGCQLKLGFDKDQKVYISKETPETVKQYGLVKKLGWIDEEHRRDIEGAAMRLLNLQEQRATAMREFYDTFIRPHEEAEN